MRVPSPTTKYGFHGPTISSVSYSRYKNNPPQEIFSSSTLGYSYRQMPVDGKPPLATNYSRKVAFVGDKGFSLTNSVANRKLWGSSRGYFTLDPVPHGSSYSSPDVASPSWMADNVLTNCINQLLDIKANLLEDAAQARQTVSMMADILRFIIDLYLLGLKGFWRRLRKLLRSRNLPTTAAGGWLMYYYGIMPLVSTMQALSETYEPRMKIFRASNRVALPVDPLGFIGSVRSSCQCSGGKAAYEVQCALAVRMHMSADLAAFTALGLGPEQWTNAIVTAWAIVPYSFVVDWILPVESYLRTRTWGSLVDYQSGYVTKRLVCDAEFTRVSGIPNIGANAQATGVFPKISVKAIQMQRIAHNGAAPTPGLSMRISLTPPQLTSAIALVIAAKG